MTPYLHEPLHLALPTPDALPLKVGPTIHWSPYLALGGGQTSVPSGSRTHEINDQKPWQRAHDGRSCAPMSDRPGRDSSL